MAFFLHQPLLAGSIIACQFKVLLYSKSCKLTGPLCRKRGWLGFAVPDCSGDRLNSFLSVVQSFSQNVGVNNSYF